jgi:hypothetical protein
MTPIEAYIRQVAPRYGIDPDVAVRVANSEGGLSDPFRQGEAMLRYGREESYGPFQLHMRWGGLGTRALAAGIDPRKDWEGGVDYALQEAGKRGWGQWFGAAKAGIGNYDGIGGKIAKTQDIQGPLHVRHPPNSPIGEPPAAGAGAAPAPAAGPADNPYGALAAKDDPKETTGDILGDAIGGLGDGGNTGFRRAQVPQLPAQAGYTTLPSMASIDPQQAMQQRNELAMAMARLNAGKLWG